MKTPLESLTVEVKDNVAQVTLIGPGKGNAMGPEFWAEMPVVFAELDADPDVRAIVLSPAVASKFRDLGFQPTGTTPEQFGEVIRRDLTKWAKIIRENNLRAD